MAKTILLADDSVTIQKVVSISFASEDVTLVTVDNGDDAIERARETRPDLILADVVMPGKSGYEVCEAIKADPELRHIPVLLLTGTFEAFDEEQASRVGAAGHVAKPFEAQTLVDRVNELLAVTPPPTAADPIPAAEVAADPAPMTVGNDDSFDFFDDDLNDAAAPAAGSMPDPMSIDTEDSAFAFGSSNIPPMDDPPASPTADTPLPDHTVAILPDDDGAVDFAFEAPLDPNPVEVPPTALSVEIDDRGYGDPADELLAVASPDVDDSFVTADATGTSDESFDFSFDGDAMSAGTPGATGPLHVEAEDVAQATVLDPNGASGYDVSSSDLGDPLTGPLADSVVEPMADPIAAPIADPIPVSMADPMADPMPVSVADPMPIPTAEPMADLIADPVADPMLTSIDVPEPVGDPLATVEPADATQFLDLAAPGDDEPIATVETVDAPAAPMADVPIFDAAPQPQPMEDARPLPSDDAARTDSVLAQITPQIQEQIHDTLEKIAWESFGDVTEKVVAEVVDRIEKVAWEVIPQLTEKLVKAEIRRMKGESED